MMITAQDREAEYFDSLGRCEVCGSLVPESELTEVATVLRCTCCSGE